MHHINLGEVYYDFYRVDGEEKADSVLNVLLKLPIEFVSRIDLDLLKIAGRYKSAGRISYADCFVLAMAEVYNAQVITSDHKEFDKIALKGKLSFRWIR
jgi:predicted nucleic acid-binding protein